MVSWIRVQRAQYNSYCVLSLPVLCSLWVRPQRRAMDCTIGLDLCIGPVVMTVQMWSRFCLLVNSRESMPASLLLPPCQSLCAAPTQLTRGEAAWHFLWVAMSHQLISSILSFLIFPRLSLILLSFCPLHLLASHLPSLCDLSFCFYVTPLTREMIKCAKKKRVLHAVTMATASPSWARIPQTCVLCISLSLLLPYLD